MDDKENDQGNVPMTHLDAPPTTVASSQSDMDAMLRPLMADLQDRMATAISNTIATEMKKIRVTMATQGAEIREEMATKIENMQNTITGKLDRLLVATPAAAIPEGNFVLSPPRGDFAAPVIQGGRWTFSLVKHKSSEDNDEYRYYLVCCAHCVLRHWFEEAQADNTANSLFLQVPEQIVNVARQVGFVFAGDNKLRDFVAFEVNLDSDNRTGLNKEDALDWPSNEGTVNLPFPNTTAGHSHSAPVQGQNVVHGDDGYDYFVVESGERGNSGTVMFLTHMTGTQSIAVSVIGVFKGTKTIGSSGTYEERGVIVSFPNFSDVVFGDLQPEADLPNQLSCTWAATDAERAHLYKRPQAENEESTNNNEKENDHDYYYSSTNSNLKILVRQATFASRSFHQNMVATLHKKPGYECL